MKIVHRPLCKDTDAVAELYSKKDKVPIKYVLTTDLYNSDQPVDVFYRRTPHPIFGNHYFGIMFKGESAYIMNADVVDGFNICCVEDDDGNLQYSQSHHDYLSFDNGSMIDGGRAYNRWSGKRCEYFQVECGELIPHKTSE